jgi:hypothetical protein
MTIKVEGKQEKAANEMASSTSHKHYYSLALSGGQWNKARASSKTA